MGGDEKTLKVGIKDSYMVKFLGRSTPEVWHPGTVKARTLWSAECQPFWLSRVTERIAALARIALPYVSFVIRSKKFRGTAQRTRPSPSSINIE
jgi:hypothetical protein